MLYESEVRGVPAVETLEQFSERSQHPVRDYTTQIVQGVAAGQPQIDELIETHSKSWSMERMPAVDRAILRIGVWELLAGDVPAPVVISEAVALATELSTDGSPRFVNGMLGAIAADVAS